MSVRKVCESLMVVLIQLIIVFLSTALFVHAVAWIFGGFFEEYAHEYGDMFFISVFYLLCLHLFVAVEKRFKSSWAKILVMMAALSTYIFVVPGGHIFIDCYFRHQSLIEIITKPESITENSWGNPTYDNCVIERGDGKLTVIRAALQQNADTGVYKVFLYDGAGDKYPAKIDIDSYEGMSFKTEHPDYSLKFNYDNKTCSFRISTDLAVTYDQKGFMSVTNNMDSKGDWESVKQNSEISKEIAQYNKKNAYPGFF